MSDHNADAASDADKPSEASSNQDTPAESETSGHALSRRGALAVLASLGLLGSATQSASAVSTTLEFGGNYTSDSGSATRILRRASQPLRTTSGLTPPGQPAPADD